MTAYELGTLDLAKALIHLILSFDKRPLEINTRAICAGPTSFGPFAGLSAHVQKAGPAAAERIQYNFSKGEFQANLWPPWRRAVDWQLLTHNGHSAARSRLAQSTRNLSHESGGRECFGSAMCSPMKGGDGNLSESAGYLDDHFHRTCAGYDLAVPRKAFEDPAAIAQAGRAETRHA